MRTVGLVMAPGVQSLDVSGPLDVFAEANNYLAADAGYRLITIGAGPAPGLIRASNGQLLGSEVDLRRAGTGYDVVLVAGGPTLPQAAADKELSKWLQAIAQTAPRYGSICNGAFLLARAGLLDGKRATTHWRDAAQLAAQFPAAMIEHDRIYVRDGRLLTSAGVTAGIDLALALLAEDHGTELALAVAKQLLVVAQRQGGQSQFSPLLKESAPRDSFAALMRSYVMDHLAEPLSVAQMAATVGMSPRNFARVFVRELQLPPAEFVQQARIDAARILLEGSSLPLKTIAYQCGFGSTARMRLTFHQRFGVTPNQYRDSFSLN